MKANIRESKGFTWIELVITIGIVSILAALAIPSYRDYTRRSYYSEIVQAAAPYRVAVGECIKTTKKIMGCNAGTHHIPAAVTTPTSPVSSIQVMNGVITVIPMPAYGITQSETYILTPSLDASGEVVWKNSGGSVTASYAK